MEEPATRDFLKPRITVPRPSPPPVIVEPIGGDVRRVGTAFDYALRYGFLARSAQKYPMHTVAEAAVELIVRDCPERAEEARARLSAALAVLGQMRGDGPLSDAAADACLDLTSLEWVFRSKSIEALDAPLEVEERLDMQLLYMITPWAELAAHKWAALNPRFGMGSRLVGGADADLCVDGTLIDIKTTKSTAMGVQYIRQLVGYAVLAEEYGIQGTGPVEIERVAIYFSRAGALLSWPLDEIISAAARREFGEFLRARHPDPWSLI